jgi:hypothetical protein
MPVRPYPSALLRLRDERGVTLVELLVALVAGLVVSFAAFSILDVSLSQSSRVADRVSADQRGRVAMEKIMLKLHSSCVAAETTPVEPNSEGNKLLIISQTGSQASFSKVTLHKIYLEGGKLIDVSYPNTEAKPAPNWEFSGTPESTHTLLTGVTQTGATPVFQYYKYEGSELSKTALTPPLSEKTAEETAAITVSFTTAPESGIVGKIANDRTVDLADTAVLRFSPASSSGGNLPCA